MKLIHFRTPVEFRVHIPRTQRELVIETALLVKVIIGAGLIGSYVLPDFHAKVVGIATGLLWLVRD